MNDLAERRKMLLLEADLHRSVIGLERVNIQTRLADLKKARERVAPGGPWLVAGSAVAGLFAVRHLRNLAVWIPTAMTAWRWMKSLTTKS